MPVSGEAIAVSLVGLLGLVFVRLRSLRISRSTTVKLQT